MNNFPITPVGTKLIIEPLLKEDEKSSGGLTLVNSTLSEGKVVAVSAQLNGLYKVDDIVLYPSKKGIEEPYNGKIFKWLDAETTKEEIYGIRQPD